MVTSIRGPSANSKPELQTSSASRSEPTMTFVRHLERQSSTETTSSQVREAKGSTIKTSTTAKELCKTCVKARNKRSMVCKEIRHWKKITQASSCCLRSTVRPLWSTRISRLISSMRWWNSVASNYLPPIRLMEESSCRTTRNPSRSKTCVPWKTYSTKARTNRTIMLVALRSPNTTWACQGCVTSRSRPATSSWWMTWRGKRMVCERPRLPECWTMCRIISKLRLAIIKTFRTPHRISDWRV